MHGRNLVIIWRHPSNVSPVEVKPPLTQPTFFFRCEFCLLWALQENPPPNTFGHLTNSSFSDRKFHTRGFDTSATSATIMGTSNCCRRKSCLLGSSSATKQLSMGGTCKLYCAFQKDRRAAKQCTQMSLPLHG